MTFILQIQDGWHTSLKMFSLENDIENVGWKIKKNSRWLPHRIMPNQVNCLTHLRSWCGWYMHQVWDKWVICFKSYRINLNLSEKNPRRMFDQANFQTHPKSFGSRKCTSSLKSIVFNMNDCQRSSHYQVPATDQKKMYTRNIQFIICHITYLFLLNNSNYWYWKNNLYMLQ